MTQAPSSRLGGWLPHVVLIAIAFAMVGVAKAKHLSAESALEIAFDKAADPDDRIWAMHVAANRGTAVDPRLGVDLVNSMLESDSDKVREAALLVDLCRHAVRGPDAVEGAPPPLQEAYAYSPLPGGKWTPHRVRSLVLHRRKVGGSGVGGNRRMELPEVQWFLDSFTTKPMPTAKEVSKYFTMRVRSAAALNTPSAESKK
jgi:hypothetical protein